MVEIEADAQMVDVLREMVADERPVFVDGPPVGYGAISGRIVGAVPVEDLPSLQALAGHRFAPGVM